MTRQRQHAHFRRSLGFAVPLAAAVLVCTSTVAARACETITVCATWDADLEDDMYGDLVTDVTYPARGARVTVIRPYPEAALGFFLDNDGCSTFDSQFRAGHKMLLYAETVVGFGGSGKIHIKSYQSTQAKNDDVDSFYMVDIPSIPDGWVVNVSAPADAEHRITHLVVATEVLHRLHGFGDSLLAGLGHELRIWVDPTRQNASAPLLDSTGDEITPGGIRVGSAGDDYDTGDDMGASALRKKFILAHEIGHWIQERVTDGGWAFDYNYGPNTEEDSLDPALQPSGGNPNDEDCWFAVEYIDSVVLGMDDLRANPNRHGIRSAEFASGAMPEGFGHFVASVAFNSDLGTDADGQFHYYKNANEMLLSSYGDFEDPGVDNRIVSLRGGVSPVPSGGADQWVAQECAEDWDHPLQAETLDQEVSSEIDWLRLFWRMVTADPTTYGPAFTFWDVVHLVTYTQVNNPWNTSDHVLWPNMRDVILDAGFSASQESRFEDLSAAHGVYNDGT